MIRSRLRTACFGAVVAILVAAGLEASVRLFLRYSRLADVVPAHIGQPDPTLGWSLIPNSSGYSYRTGYEVAYRINSKGLRGDEVDYQKPTGRFRIVLLGDSRTFGYGVSIEKHFSTLLQGYFKGVDVINLGISGFGVDQELLYLRLEGVKYQPDLVLAYVAHYGNHRHMHDRRWGHAKPRFELKDGRLALRSIGLPASRRSVLGWIDRRLDSSSRAYEAVKGMLGWAVTAGESARDAAQDALDDHNPAFRKELFALGDVIIDAMNTESAEHAARFVLVTLMPELREAAHRKSIPCIYVQKQLDNPLFALPANLEHTNESGNGVLAWEIARFLMEEHLVPAGHWLGTTESDK